MSSEESPRRGIAPANKIIVCIIGLVVIAVLLFWLFKGKTTTVKAPPAENADSSTLSCVANNIDNSIFSTDDANYTSYDFSIIFHNGKLYNLTYSFSGTYADNTTAIRAEADLHTGIGKYLQDRDTTLESFSSNNFSIHDNEVRFSIYATSQEITAQSAPVLMIDTLDDDTGATEVLSTISEIKENYTKRGFTCQKQD